MFSSEQRLKIMLQLQKNPQNIRNISIVAHVDHGKTTLSDSLISFNNIINKKQAGKLRYLDNRQDEQLRGITMKSSSISLIYQQQNQDYLINLIDSPGHVEFNSEVSSALRLTDGALILVDVIEGISAQTYTVIKQCFSQKVKSFLVLNKIDRLIMEWQQTPIEAYRHLSQIIEQVNAILGQLIKADNYKNEKIQNENQPKNEEKQEQEINVEDQLYEIIESQIYFAPEKGNIIFCSALDTWAFTTNTFAEIFSQKLKCNQKILQKYLYGDYYFNPKTKRILNKPPTENSQPMFVEFILKNIWGVYERVKNCEVDKIEKFTKSLNIDPVPQKHLEQIATNPYPIIQYLMNSWIPLDKSIFQNVITYMPNPKEAQQSRLDVISKKLAHSSTSETIDPQMRATYQLLREGIQSCNQSEDAPTIIFISKMVNIPKENINERGLQDVNKLTSRYFGFARIFSGCLKRGKEVYVIGPKSKVQIDEQVQADIQKIQIENIYLMMGQYLEGVSEVPAGNILALGGLDNIVYKTATVCSIPTCPSFTPVDVMAKSILKVALTTQSLDNQPKLIEGLKKLNKSDPSVEVFTQANGDVILATCGQVHLERCITDLEQLMAKVKVQMSEPIVSFKETITYRKLVVVNNSKQKAEQTQQKKKENIEQEQQSIQLEEKNQEKELKMKILKGCSDVEIVDLTKQEEEPDIRYGLLQEKEKKDDKKYNYKQVKEIKKLDYFNKGKTHQNINKVNIINLLNKQNLVTLQTPNQKIAITVRAIGFNFELAEWLEKQQNVMRKLFFDTNRKRLKEKDDIEWFLQEFEKQVNIHITEKMLREMILQKLVSFGPNRYGPNLLLIKKIQPEDNLLFKLRERLQAYTNVQQQQDENGQRQNQMYQLLPNIQQQQVDIEEEKVVLAEEKAVMTEEKDSREQSSASKQAQASDNIQKKIEELYKISQSELNNAIIQGFLMAVLSGPLCEEPMIGVCYIVEEIKLQTHIEDNNNCEQAQQEQKDLSIGSSDTKITKNKNDEPEESILSENQKQQLDADQNLPQQQQQKEEEKAPSIDQQKIKDDKNSEKNSSVKTENSKSAVEQCLHTVAKDPYGPIVGQIISTMKETCVESFLGANPRLVEGMYLCQLQCDNEIYPKVWEVLNKRRAQIVMEELQESSNLFLIKTHLPVQESINFYSEMQIKTSGRVSAQLVFDTWKILDIDPFYTPQTEEEIEEFGEQILLPNLAKLLIDKIRKRKGIATEQKIVVAAEKQRNLSKKK